MELTPESALVLVDIQCDFLPGGALAVRRGDEVVAAANRLADGFHAHGFQVVCSRDWHPADHSSFQEQGGPWPAHCVQDTHGAEFADDLVIPEGAWVISKGTDPAQDAYSAFQGTDLEKRLREAGVRMLYICGLATDYCVKHTVLEAIDAGFDVVLVADACRGVNVHAADSAGAVEDMLRKGARIASSGAVQNALEAYSATH
ncbi:MAG: bifunctional nicotinamidase/pyrazinamidase [Candidatus Krumholzibacteriia bacterium]